MGLLLLIAFQWSRVSFLVAVPRPKPRRQRQISGADEASPCRNPLSQPPRELPSYKSGQVCSPTPPPSIGLSINGFRSCFLHYMFTQRVGVARPPRPPHTTQPVDHAVTPLTNRVFTPALELNILSNIPATIMESPCRVAPCLIDSPGSQSELPLDSKESVDDLVEVASVHHNPSSDLLRSDYSRVQRSSPYCWHGGGAIHYPEKAALKNISPKLTEDLVSSINGEYRRGGLGTGAIVYNPCERTSGFVNSLYPLTVANGVPQCMFRHAMTPSPPPVTSGAYIRPTPVGNQFCYPRSHPSHCRGDIPDS
ncbi:hypothetical protein J6590_029612 [Homalodisca vitripennis]|nr:hypothetical protein J6590_029612 [Homalodisca vitripennis]